jgi:NarL family two-component system response regulator LiaR
MDEKTEPITTLLVDDHKIVRSGVRSYLETQSDILIVGEASDGEEGVKLALELLPDVVLMDLIMPGCGGVEATRRIKEATPRTQIIVLTSFHEDTQILPAIRAGALSYLLKDIGPEELGTAVRLAARGEAVLHPYVAAQVMQSIRQPNHTAKGVQTDLSDRELEVLRLIADGMPNAEIGQRLFISERTVKSHVSNILSKLQLADRTQAAVYAWREGIVTSKPSTPDRL